MAEEDSSIFAVSCRTDGIGGPYIWIAAAVNNKGRLHKTAYFNGVVNIDMLGLNCPYADTKIRSRIEEFQNLNETDIRHPTEYQSYADLLNAFWDFYLSNRHGSLLVTDYKFNDDKELRYPDIVTWNPEGMFAACINLDLQVRDDQHCHVLLDLSTLLFSKGISTMCNRSRFIQNYNCSLVPADWATDFMDPLREALTTLSVAKYLLNIKK